MRVAANLATMFTDVPLLGRYEKAAKVGFKLVEVPFPYSIPASELKKEADRNNISHVLINAPVGNFEGGDRGLAAIPEKSGEFRESIKTALEYAKILDCQKIHVMSGYLKSDKEVAEKIFIENLIFANDIFEKEGIQLLIEPINSYTIPGYFLNSMDQAVSILDKVKSENVKILFDVFHIQQIHGQITGLVKRFEGKIGHIQVAQVPDRHEPDSPGELDYKYVFNLLSSVNVNWTIGCEYFNSGTTEWKMIRITDRESSKTFLIPADHEGCLSFSTLKQYFAGATGLVYLADNRKDEIAVLFDKSMEMLLPPANGWNRNFYIVRSSISAGYIGSKRKRVEDVLSEEEKNSYWELYRHYLFYTNLDEKTKAAASLLDDHRLVLCLHEIPTLQEIRRELIRLSTELEEFLRGYNGNESFKEEYFSKLQKKISTKEKKLKFKASRTVMEFVDYKDETFLTKVEYYNWQHDICIMRSLKVLHHATPRTEYCERGTNYIMLGFRPPEYSHCIIDGIVSGSMNGRYLCGAPGAFPGMSGGPVLQKFANGRGRLLGICSGAKDAQIGIHSSFGEALNALSDAQTNLPYVLIVPAFQLLFGLPEKTKSYELMKAIEELHLSRPSSAISMTKDGEDKNTQTES